MARMASAIKCNERVCNGGWPLYGSLTSPALQQVDPGFCVVMEVNIDKAMEDAARLCTFWVRQQLQDGTEITRKHKKDNLLAYKTAFAENKLKLVVPGSNLSLVKIEK